MYYLRTVTVFLLLTGLIIGAGSCKKYENGPAFSLRSKTKRLSQAWELESYYLNGSEATSSLVISKYTEEYKDDGTYIRSYVDGDGDDFSETGKWEFDENKDFIEIGGVSSIELSDENSTVTNSRSTILRLKNKELWYKFENGGDEHEFHLTQK